MRSAYVRVMVGVACLVVAAGSASAQTVRAGVKGGVALTSIPLAGDILDQISETESDDVRAKVGVTGGGFVEFVLNERFSFQPELLFVMKGVKLDLPGETGQVTAALNYLEFPLLGRFSATLTDVLKGYIFVGPTFGVTVGTDSTFDSAAGTEDLNIDPAFERRDFGLTFGGGLERDGRYLIEARYNLGLADIATDIFAHDDALRNRAFSVMIGIRLP